MTGEAGFSASSKASGHGADRVKIEGRGDKD
jgi:hypothetical protein